MGRGGDSFPTQPTLLYTKRIANGRNRGKETHHHHHVGEIALLFFEGGGGGGEREESGRE